MYMYMYMCNIFRQHRCSKVRLNSQTNFYISSILHVNSIQPTHGNDAVTLFFQCRQHRIPLLSQNRLTVTYNGADHVSQNGNLVLENFQTQLPNSIISSIQIIEGTFFSQRNANIILNYLHNSYS